MSYITLNKDTANIRNMVIVCDKVLCRNIIRLSPGEGVSQIGIGLDSDGHGQAFLYVIENGKECEFTILGSDSYYNNNMILETASGSRIILEGTGIRFIFFKRIFNSF